MSVSRNNEIDTLGVRVTGVDLDEDLTAFNLLLLDAEEGELGRLNNIRFRDIVYGEGQRFTASW